LLAKHVSRWFTGGFFVNFEDMKRLAWRLFRRVWSVNGGTFSVQAGAAIAKVVSGRGPVRGQRVCAWAVGHYAAARFPACGGCSSRA
jgi:hypothetical protein